MNIIIIILLHTSRHNVETSETVATHVEIARTCSKLVADRFEAKFHYALWSQTGPKLIADLSHTC